MEIENLYQEPYYIDSIRQQLQIINKVFLDGDEFLKIPSDSVLKANLLKAMDYLEKEKDQLPRFYRREIDFLLREVRYKLSHE